MPGTGNVDDVADVLEADRVGARARPTTSIAVEHEAEREARVKDPLEEVQRVETSAARWHGILVAFLVALVVARRLRAREPRSPLLIVVGIILMVMLHEAGHYSTAKRAGMKVTEFFLGFGPRLWSFQRGETEYGVKAIPPAATCASSG